MTPTELTLKELRKQGYLAAVVEKWIAQTKQRKDLYDLIDILAIRPGEVLGVQATTGSHGAARVKKALASPHIEKILASPLVFEVWTWSKKGKAGARKLWSLTRRRIVPADLVSDPAPESPPSPACPES